MQRNDKDGQVACCIGTGDESDHRYVMAEIIRQFSVLSYLICNSAIDAHCAFQLSRVGKRHKATTTTLLGCFTAACTARTASDQPHAPHIMRGRNTHSRRTCSVALS